MTKNNSEQRVGNNAEQKARSPKSPKKKVKNITALFLGYMGSGKTTFLTAAIAASQLGKIGFAITEKIRPEEKSYFAEQINKLSRRDHVIKTEGTIWEELNLWFEVPGKERVYVRTIDYPGELAGSDIIDKNVQKLQKFISESHCLYLFLDASLSPKLSPSEGENLRKQGESINRARELFEQEKRVYPIIVVITKADLLFSGRTPKQVQEGIAKLNSNKKLAKERFRELFPGHLSEGILKAHQKKPVKICYVASLGTRPEIVDGDLTEKSLHEQAYVIKDWNKWTPLGIEETLQVGISKAALGETLSKMSDTIHNNILPVVTKVAVSLLILASIGFASYQWDKMVAQQIDELVVKYENGSVEPSIVLENAKRVKKFWHPFIFFADRQTIIGKFPDWFANIDKTILRMGVPVLQQKLQLLHANVETLEAELIELTLNEAANKVGEHKERWQAFVNEVSEVIGNSGNPEQKTAIKNDILMPSQREFAIFYQKSVEILWRLAKDQDISIEETETSIQPYFQDLIRLKQELPVYDDVITQTVEESSQVYTRGKCDILIDDYRNVELENTKDFSTQVELLSMICSECQHSDVKEQICERLLAKTDLWDYYEAKSIYDSFPHDQRIYSVTSNKLYELHQKFQQYTEHVDLRKEKVPQFVGRYETETQEFLKWHEGLNRGYFIQSMNLQIYETTSFLRSEERIETHSNFLC